MDSHAYMSPAWLLNEVGANMLLSLYMARFQGARFDRGWDQTIYGSWTLLHIACGFACSAHKLLTLLIHDYPCGTCRQYSNTFLMRIHVITIQKGLRYLKSHGYMMQN